MEDLKKKIYNPGVIDEYQGKVGENWYGKEGNTRIYEAKFDHC